MNLTWFNTGYYNAEKLDSYYFHEASFLEEVDDSHTHIYNTDTGFLGDSVIKNLPANAGDVDSIPGLRRSPEGGNGNPLQHSCLENLMERERSLAGYSPWGHKELDAT